MAQTKIVPVMTLHYSNMAVGDNQDGWAHFYHMPDGSYLANDESSCLISFTSASEVCEHIDKTYIDATDYYGNEQHYYVFSNLGEAKLHFSGSKLVSGQKENVARNHYIIFDLED
jgi:hypothetical protein